MNHTKQAFATICGTNTKSLAVYIQRNQVVVDADGEINLNHPVNKKFLEKRLEKIKSKDTGKTQIQTPPVNSDDNHNDLEEASIEGLNLSQLDKRKKLIEIKKLHKEVDLLSLRKEKIQGEVIPVIHVKDIIHRLSAHLTNEYKSSLEDFLTNAAGDFRVSSELFAKYRGRIIETINNANDRAVDLAKIDIRSLVEQYAQVRAKGEKK